MGNTQTIHSVQKASFEDIQYCIEHTHDHILISTLPVYQQECLILKTISASVEEDLINKVINEGQNKNMRVIIYGSNYSDETIYDKYTQLSKLGFTNIYVYPGGVFEWLLLQDIYGKEDFQTTSDQLDILKYKPSNIIHGGNRLLENG